LAISGALNIMRWHVVQETPSRASAPNEASGAPGLLLGNGTALTVSRANSGQVPALWSIAD
jgi:hypothetical protein